MHFSRVGNAFEGTSFFPYYQKQGLYPTGSYSTPMPALVEISSKVNSTHSPLTLDYSNENAKVWLKINRVSSGISAVVSVGGLLELVSGLGL